MKKILLFSLILIIHNTSFSMYDLILGSSDGTIKKLDKDYNPKTLIKYKSGLTSMAASPNGKLLASGSYDGNIKICEINKLNKKNYKPKVLGKNQGGHAKRINSVKFSPNGKLLASASSDSTIKIWDMDKLNNKDYKPKTLDKIRNGIKPFICTCKIKLANGINSITFSSNGKYLASTYVKTCNSAVKIWEIERLNEKNYKPKILKEEFRFHYPCSIAFNPNGKLLAVGTDSGGILIFDINTFKCLHGLNTSENESGRCIKTLQSESLLTKVTFSSDGKHLVSNGYDNTLKLWDLNKLDKTGKVINLNQNKRGFSLVSFNPNASQLVSIANDSTIQIWNMNKLKLIKEKRHANIVKSIAWIKINANNNTCN